MKSYTFHIDKTKYAVLCDASYSVKTRHGLDDAVDILNGELWDYGLVAKDPVQRFDGSYDVTLDSTDRMM